jgi:gliding motility-associated-like protein
MPAPLRAYILTLVVQLLVHGAHSQCPFPASVSTTGNCIGDTLTVRAAAPLTQIVWLRGGLVDKLSNSKSDTSYKPTQPGTYTAAISNNDGCTVTVGPIVLKDLNNNLVSFGIFSSNAIACSGKPITFTAVTSFNDPGFIYRWLVNGKDAGDPGPQFNTNSLSNGDVVSCIVIDNNTCDAGASNSISMTVYASPHIAPHPPISLSLGESVTLMPIIDGDISSYSWSPAAGLSNSFIVNPVATPSKNTIYTLEVETSEGCKDIGEIAMKVFSPLHIPNAFTPNGDGKNEVFYIQGGPQGSRIRNFSIFNRWGQKVFQRTNIPSGDPAFGWDGYYNGAAALPEVYIYTLTLGLADGSSQVFRGTVILVR